MLMRESLRITASCRSQISSDSSTLGPVGFIYLRLVRAADFDDTRLGT